MSLKTLPPLYREPECARLIALVAQSFARLLGRPLVPDGADVIAAVWDVPLAIVAHGTQAEPLFSSAMPLRLVPLRPM